MFTFMFVPSSGGPNQEFTRDNPNRISAIEYANSMWGKGRLFQEVTPEPPLKQTEREEVGRKSS